MPFANLGTACQKDEKGRHGSSLPVIQGQLHARNMQDYLARPEGVICKDNAVAHSEPVVTWA